MLDQIATCSIEYSSRPWVAVLGVVSILIGWGLGAITTPVPGEIAAALAVTGVGLLIGYFLTRKNTLEISTAGDSIVVPVTGTDRDKLMEVIHSIELARWTAARPGAAAAAL
jgi:hypothetical protein